MVALAVGSNTRDGAITEIAELFSKDPRVSDPKQLLAEIMAREATESTCLGFDTAIPHARTDLVREMVMAVGRSHQGVTFGCGKTAKFIFLIANPRPVAPEYLRFVGALARAMRSDETRSQLMAAEDPNAFIRVLARANVG